MKTQEKQVNPQNTGVWTPNHACPFKWRWRSSQWSMLTQMTHAYTFFRGVARNQQDARLSVGTTCPIFVQVLKSLIKLKVTYKGTMRFGLQQSFLSMQKLRTRWVFVGNVLDEAYVNMGTG